MREKGINDVDSDYVHSMELSNLLHEYARHKGDNRGQIPLSDDELCHIVDILENFDDIVKGGTAKSTGLQTIRYEKKSADGSTTYYVEEIRTGRKSLAFKTAYKKKNGIDSSDEMLSNNSTTPITPKADSDNLNSDNKDTENSSNGQGNDGNNSQANENGGGRARFMVSGERDADYMDAVEKGDEEKAGRMVREAARRAMPKTKVADENGEPLVMSHNTDREFNTFDRERIGTGQGQAYLGYGFNFSRGFCSTYGKNEMRVYLDARSPLQSGGHKLTRRKLEKAIRLIDQKQSSTLVGEFCGGAMPYGSREYERNIGRAIDMLREYDDLSIYASISMTSYDATPSDVIEAFKAIGFDSSIERNSEGRIVNAVVFDPNQIKSANPVTYDDAGNVIPLSERFNPEKEDVRFMTSGVDDGRTEEIMELDDQSEEAQRIYNLPDEYGLKGYADTACIRERDEIEQYQRYFPDDLIKGLYEEFDDPHSFGYHSNDVVVVFTGKIKPDDGEIVWWHEQTHNIYSKLSKEEREVYGKACLDYLEKNNNKLYNHILSEYPKEEWLDEACAYFIGNAIDEYGAYAFLNFNLEGGEDIINFVTTFRNHIKYGEGTRENRGNQLRQRFQEAEDSSFLHTLQERGPQSQELEGGAGQEDQGGSGSRAGQEGEQPGDRVRFMSDEGGGAEESEVRDESEGGEAEGSEMEGGRTAEEEAAEAVAMEPVEPAEMSLKEQVLQGLMAAAERYRQSGTVRTSAVREISAYVSALQNAWRKRKGLNKEALEQTIGAKVRRGMSWQKAEDQALVEQTVRLAKLMLQIQL